MSTLFISNSFTPGNVLVCGATGTFRDVFPQFSFIGATLLTFDFSLTKSILSRYF